MLIFKDGVTADHKYFFPNTSFPQSGPNDDFLKENDAYRVVFFIEHDREVETLVSCEPYVKNGFAYVVKIETKSEEDIKAELESRAAKIRATRDRLLSESDWTQLKDAKVDSDAWGAYRQTLRDIPSQEGFPMNVVFPDRP